MSEIAGTLEVRTKGIRTKRRHNDDIRRGVLESEGVCMVCRLSKVTVLQNA